MRSLVILLLPMLSFCGNPPILNRGITPRDHHAGATLEMLYDAQLMPPNLRAAHKGLDRAVDRLYRKAPFDSDRERVEHLFLLHQTAATPLLPPAKVRRQAARVIN